jgi:predicted aminopeptidase
MALSACAEWPYYTQSVGGHLSILFNSRPIAEVMDDPGTSAQLRQRLDKARRIRRFASEQLGLPENQSFDSYSPLDRPFVVWNVVAAPELSLAARQWCFAVVGCVAYRGYFHKDAADNFAQGMKQQGYDVYVGGVPAYSTLGWLDDPLPSTVIGYPEAHLAGLIFHELAHQVVYVKDDVAFNESFATTVELEGARRWFQAAGDDRQLDAFLLHKRRNRKVVEMIFDYRERLQAVYQGSRDDHWKRAQKARLLVELKSAYRSLKRGWQDYRGFDHWFDQPLNNAHLVTIGTYHRYVPAFQAMLAQERGDLRRFYRRVKKLGRLPGAQRAQRLAHLLSAGD